ncbi:MAG: hypothetical protein JNL64_10765 [Blastocatellia bacterium]|jgi:hypothetical protein|nr:hypothetical protein [Blastocatellia bacterium]
MKVKLSSLSLVIAAIAIFASVSTAQVETFSDPDVEYTFMLPDARWKMTASPSASSSVLRYVFVDRNDAQLEVRKLSKSKSELLSEFIRNNEESKLQPLPGYIPGREENFKGKLEGIIFNYEYVLSGRSMVGRFYYLEVNDTTVYVLRFTGNATILKSIRNQTDSIARTFDVK